jgi:hypothetical protein
VCRVRSVFERYSCRPLRGALLAAIAAVCAAPPARAEVTLFDANGWQAFTDGRVQAFLSYGTGDTYPPTLTLQGAPDVTAAPEGGGVTDVGSTKPDSVQGDYTGFRVRSGFTGNVFGFGVRKKISESTTVKGYIHINSVVESVDRRKFETVEPDVRQGYLELSGDFGRFLAGRTFTLYSRGATDITYRYGFRYGVGFVQSPDNLGPTSAHVGFGVLGNGFSAGFMYTTPQVAGLELAVALFDPSGLVGSPWERTKYPRPEAELTYDLPFSNGLLHFFVNGAWQRLFERNAERRVTVQGFGYGARVEVGPVRLGLAGHMGTGLGISYAFEPSPATYGQPEENAELRDFDGYYAQLQVALGKFDVSSGVGITRVKPLIYDRVNFKDDDGDPLTPALNDDGDLSQNDPLTINLLKHQLGISAGVVYHITDELHFGADFFRADFRWQLGGVKQVLNFVNAGMTFEW